MSTSITSLRVPAKKPLSESTQLDDTLVQDKRGLELELKPPEPIADEIPTSDSAMRSSRMSSSRIQHGAQRVAVAPQRMPPAAAEGRISTPEMSATRVQQQSRVPISVAEERGVEEELPSSSRIISTGLDIPPPPPTASASSLSISEIKNLMNDSLWTNK